jgi:trimeric autotransporter adhesin
MSNEELPQSAELASAYLDGELDAPERVAAAADPEVMAAVDSFTRVRAALSQTDPLVTATKDAAIAAALAEFDALRSTTPAAAAPAATAIVTSLQSRRARTYRVLTGVAAAAIIGVVAIAALNSSGSGDDALSSAAATAAPTELPELKSAADTASAPAATGAAASDAAGSAEATADTLPVIDTPEALTQYAARVEIAATTAAAPAEPFPSSTTVAAAGTAPVADNGSSAVSCPTSDQFVLGAIFYQGTPALVVRDSATGALRAIDDTNCRVLVEVPAP